MIYSAKTLMFAFTVFAVVTVLLLIMRNTAFFYLKRWFSKTPFQLDLIILKSVRIPSIFWCIAGGLYIALDFSELTKKQYDLINKGLIVLVIFSVSLALANLSGRVFKTYVDKLNTSIPATGLFYGLLKGAIIGTGLIIIMSALGVSIAPVLTALGVGGLAVALALKDTLENLFAGIHILIEKTIRVGDFIGLESGQEGIVEDITWRTTRIRMLQNNMVIIPNSKLSQSVVINYSLPENRMSLRVPVSVSYDADPEIVESILIDEVKRAAEDIEEITKDFEPLVRFNPGFGESSIDFTLICQITHVNHQFSVLHQLRKRIFKRLKKEGIEIPYPQRVVHLRNEG